MQEHKPLDIAEFNRDMISFLIRQSNNLIDKNKWLEKEVKKLRYEMNIIIENQLRILNREST